ncbi:hypothetical protein WA026_004519 [Henosepilachna vigintioctopunctata]|uniref:Uncharacterized protein n=1 Tax=Henosepilachna vigintioctopunctata TaxID=420089 RepID=A0AAW1V0P7_9CUCU
MHERFKVSKSQEKNNIYGNYSDSENYLDDDAAREKLLPPNKLGTITEGMSVVPCFRYEFLYSNMLKIVSNIFHGGALNTYETIPATTSTKTANLTLISVWFSL